MPRRKQADKDTKVNSLTESVKVIGRVVSAKLPKTATVLVERKQAHPLYQKAFKRSKRYLVHDEIGVSVGDLVGLVHCRPISKHKRLKVIKILGKNVEAVVTEEIKTEAAKAIAEVLPEEKGEGKRPAEEKPKKKEVIGKRK